MAGVHRAETENVVFLNGLPIYGSYWSFHTNVLFCKFFAILARVQNWLYNMAIYTLCAIICIDKSLVSLRVSYKCGSFSLI